MELFTFWCFTIVLLGCRTHKNHNFQAQNARAVKVIIFSFSVHTYTRGRVHVVFIIILFQATTVTSRALNKIISMTFATSICYYIGIYFYVFAKIVTKIRFNIAFIFAPLYNFLHISYFT